MPSNALQHLPGCHHETCRTAQTISVSGTILNTNHMKHSIQIVTTLKQLHTLYITPDEVDGHFLISHGRHITIQNTRN